MDELEKSAYRFMNLPRNDKEKLEEILQCDIIQAIEDGFNGHDVKRDEILKDINWLVEQALKIDRYEKVLKDISVNCDSSIYKVVAKRALKGK